MKTRSLISFSALACLSLLWAEWPGEVRAAEEAAVPEPPAISEQTEECLFCHEMLNPGLVADWRTSRHSRTTPTQALQRPEVERRFSASEVPEALRNVVVGCYECHSLNAEAHADNFEHEGYRINVVVSPRDCQTCHPTEVEQYAGSKKAHAWGNLKLNPLYHTMVQTVGNPPLNGDAPAHLTAVEDDEACYACHGTKVEVDGMKTIVLPDESEIEVPNLLRWPNQGVGRINPDGSRGACTACHPRHSFSIEVARKPRTCAQCHLAPDTPAWEVYRESKHGNLMLSLGDRWNWDHVPWVPGQDFTAPTCATCHASLLADAEGEVLVERTHDYGSRLWVRIFGLPYSHPQPKHGATHVIRNADGQPLPTTFAGEPAAEFLISPDEQAARRETMTKVCRACHGTDYAQSHFARLDRAIARTDEMTRQGTEVMQRIWKNGGADPKNPFDELAELKWVQHWLFYATSVRYAAAMGGPDYATFKNGWWALHRNLRELEHLAGEATGGEDGK